MESLGCTEIQLHISKITFQRSKRDMKNDQKTVRLKYSMVDLHPTCMKWRNSQNDAISKSHPIMWF